MANTVQHLEKLLELDAIFATKFYEAVMDGTVFILQNLTEELD